MAEKSPEHGLTRSGRGWYRRCRGKWTWIVSSAECPTAADADRYFAENIKTYLPDDDKPKGRPGVVMLSDLCDAFLAFKRTRLAAGDLEERSLADWRSLTRDMLEVMGDRPVYRLGPEDFAKLARHWQHHAPSTRRRWIVAVRSVFKWGHAAPRDLPLPGYGEAFALPSRRVLRRHKARRRTERGVLAFDPLEVRAQLEGTTIRRRDGKPLPVRPTPALRAMILLGVNCGFGNIDVARLPLERHALDLEAGWATFPRPKTGADRRAKLWPETVAAVRAYLEVRPKPARREWGRLMFLTREGFPVVRKKRHREDWVERIDTIAPAFRRLLKHLGQHRDGVGFNSLRRTFRTVAAETGQERIINAVMGHADDADDMGATYTQTLLDAGFVQVSDHVRSRVFTSGTSSPLP